MKFRVCFTLAKYKNDVLSLCETTYVLLMLICYFKIPFHQLWSFTLIITMLKPLNVCKVYLQCGIVILRQGTKHGLPRIQLSRMMNLKIEFATNKCLGTIGSTAMNPIAWTYPARVHYKNAYFLWLYNLTPLSSWPIFFNTISTPDYKRRVTQQYLTYFVLI